MTDVPRPTPGARPLTRRAALVGLAAGAAALLPAPAWAATEQRPGAVRAPRFDAFDRRIVRQLSAERALGHISQLSEGIGPRIGGTESEYRAARYLAGQLDDLGYSVRLEPFPVADKFLAQLSAAPGLTPDLCWQGGASPQGALDVTATGPVVDVRGAPRPSTPPTPPGPCCWSTPRPRPGTPRWRWPSPAAPPPSCCCPPTSSRRGRPRPAPRC